MLFCISELFRKRSESHHCVFDGSGFMLNKWTRGNLTPSGYRLRVDLIAQVTIVTYNNEKKTSRMKGFDRDDRHLTTAFMKM